MNANDQDRLVQPATPMPWRGMLRRPLHTSMK